MNRKQRFSQSGDASRRHSENRYASAVEFAFPGVGLT
jgi:hypothetical protein